MAQRRLSWSEFCRVVQAEIAHLPAPFAPYLENLVVDVESAPSRRLLKELEVPAGETLFGLFQGRGIDEMEFGHAAPNRVVLFKDPIEQASGSLAEVRYEIRRTLLHELGHHFGFSEEDLEFFESQPSPFDDDGNEDSTPEPP